MTRGFASPACAGFALVGKGSPFDSGLLRSLRFPAASGAAASPRELPWQGFLAMAMPQLGEHAHQGALEQQDEEGRFVFYCSLLETDDPEGPAIPQQRMLSLRSDAQPEIAMSRLIHSLTRVDPGLPGIALERRLGRKGAGRDPVGGGAAPGGSAPRRLGSLSPELPGAPDLMTKPILRSESP